MRFVLHLIGAVVVAVILGLGSAYYVARYAVQGEALVANGPWVTNLETGGTDADIYTRAFVALTGLLALNKSETIYYNATADSDGNALDGRCSYRIEGRDPDARWWSMTVYGRDHYLVDNPSKRYSVSQTTVTREPGGSFVVRLSTVEETGNWIATSPDGFQVTLRLYNPGVSVREEPGSVPLPAIVKESCS